MPARAAANGEVKIVSLFFLQLTPALFPILPSKLKAWLFKCIYLISCSYALAPSSAKQIKIKQIAIKDFNRPPVTRIWLF